jgi:hypothetical protein
MIGGMSASPAGSVEPPTEDDKFLGMPKTTGYIVVGVGAVVVLGVVGFLVFGRSGAGAPVAPAK